MLLRRLLPASLPLSLFLLGLAACASALPASPTPAPADPPPEERACTQIGCVDGLTVDLQSPAGWQPGVYRFELELDGEKITCEGSLPLQRCEEGPSVRCAPAATAQQVQISESGCALPPSQHGLPQIALPKAPARVELTISRDGTEIASEQISPQYRTVMPNGPECGPVCSQASAAILLR